jgi:hypothetical protein
MQPQPVSPDTAGALVTISLHWLECCNLHRG